MPRDKVNPTVLRADIETLYIAVTGSKTPHGALTWLADEIEVNERTLRRWCSGDSPPPLMLRLLLDYKLKHDIGKRKADPRSLLTVAREQRDEWHRNRGD